MGSDVLKVTRERREDLDHITEEFHAPINLEKFQELCASLGLLKETPQEDERPRGRVTITFQNLVTINVYRDKYQIMRLKQCDKYMLGYIMLFIEKLSEGKFPTAKDMFFRWLKVDAKRALTEFGKY